MNFRGKLREQEAESVKVGRIHESGHEKCEILEIPMDSGNFDFDGTKLWAATVHYQLLCGRARSTLKVVVNFFKNSRPNQLFSKRDNIQEIHE